MAHDTRYLEYDVCGSPRELGRQIGEAAGEQVRGFCAAAMELIHRSVQISAASAMLAAKESMAFVEAYAPHMLEELRGVADASGVTVEELMLLQIRNQLQADDSGCTAFSLGGPWRMGSVVAQNWDNDPALDEFTIVLTRRPEGKPAFTTVTQAGLISYIGFNDAGMGVCVNSLPAPSRQLGVPHYFTMRGIYEADSLAAAVHAVRRAERAIPANIVMSTPQGPADLEVTLDDVRLLTAPDDDGLLTHTNHCEHAELLELNARFPELIQSHARKRRIEELLRGKRENSEAGDGANGATLELLKTALRDHQDYPRSICRHTNDDPHTGFWQTVLSVIIEPNERRMHITRGAPCENPYETYVLK